MYTTHIRMVMSKMHFNIKCFIMACCCLPCILIGIVVDVVVIAGTAEFRSICGKGMDGTHASDMMQLIKIKLG